VATYSAILLGGEAVHRTVADIPSVLDDAESPSLVDVIVDGAPGDAGQPRDGSYVEVGAVLAEQRSDGLHPCARPERA
jgi:hypothetical protein